MDGEIRVLYVDDDPEAVEAVTSFLRQHAVRMSVATATEPEAGRATLREGAFDCVVAEYELSGATGIELLEAVREQHPDLPFVLFTGTGSESVASDAISAGVTDYIRKGNGTERLELLVNRVENAVAKYRTARELDRQQELFAKTQRLADVGAWEWYPATGEGFYTEQVHEIYAVEDRSDGAPEANIVKFYHPDDQEAIRSAFRTAVEAGEPYDLEVRVIDADGDEKWVRTRGDPQFVDGECVRIRGTIQNITERKEREEELQRQVDRLEEFTGVVSHDLRNPLNVAMGRLDIATEECDSQHLAQVADALDRMEAIIEDTLTLARQGQTVDETEPVAVGSLIEDCWEVVDSGDAELQVLDEFTVEADRNRLSQIFENLFRNAVEHSSTSPGSQARGDAVEHGSSDTATESPGAAHSATSRRPQARPAREEQSTPVTIRVGQLTVMHTATRAETDGTFGFFVEDDGPGIDPDRREAVFEPGESSRDDGTGFGLSIVKRIAEAHGWEVSLDESFEGGARFEFTDVR